MFLREFRSCSGVSATVFRGIGLSLGSAALVGTMPAIAAPLFPGAAESSPTEQTAQADKPSSASDDVIVETEPQKPDSTPDPSGTASPGGRSSDSLASTRFSCEYSNGQFVVMYHPESQPGKSYAWANPSAMGGGWTPERRCNEISRRLETYRPDGLLEMQTGLENGYNTVCVTTQKVASCRIVLTVPPGQDPTSTRDRVFQNLTVADSGQRTDAVNTFVESGQSGGIVDELGKLVNISLPNLGKQSSYSDGINLRPFLDTEDGGTGAQLRGGSLNPPAPRLNPNNFR